MNSLEELNGFGQSSIVFEDPQATPTFGTFVDDGLPNLSGFATEDSFYKIGDNPFGGNFVGAEGLDNATNNNIKVSIHVSGNALGGGSGYFFDTPDLPRNVTATIISSAQTLEYELIQTNVDMHYLINNTRVYLKNAPSEQTSSPGNTVITVSVEWDQSTSPAPNIRSQATILTITQLPELGNVGDRTYVGNQFNSIFNSNPIEILDENFYAPDFDNVEYDEGSVTNPEQYALTLNTSIGSWKTLTNTAPYPSSVTLFGTKDQIRTQVQGTKYVPSLGSTATATVSYHLETPTVTFDPATDTYPVNWQRTVDGVTFDIVGTARTTPASWEGEFNHNSSPIAVIEEMTLFSIADVLVVGGGGGGGAISTRTQLTANEDGLTGGGGGSGYFFEMQGSNLLQQANAGDTIHLTRGLGGAGAGWDTLQYPADGTNSEILINSTPVVVAPGGGRGGSSYNAPNQPYGLGTPTTAFVEFNGANGGMGGGAAGSNLNMPGGGQTFGGTGGVGAVNTLSTSGGITQTFGLNGDNGSSTGSGWDAGGGGGTPTTGGSGTIPSGPTILSQVIDVGSQFCEHAPAGGININQFNPTQYPGSGGKGMGYTYFSTAPRDTWDAQDGFDGKVKIRIRQA